MTDDLESQLRDHLHRRADAVHASATTGGDATILQASRQRTAARHRRRMATASALTVAAVSVGLVVVARDPGSQDVSTNRNQPEGAVEQAAGAATGSSTGSATGSPQGWSYEEGDTSGIGRYALRLGPEFTSYVGGRSGVRGSGQGAADLAVAAEVVAGQPIRFVVASVQDADRLTSGTGGTVTTINDRPARVVSRRGATTITWDLSDTKRVLVFAAGVDDDTLASWLGALGQDAAGQWSFTSEPAATGGLTVVPTTTPTSQANSYASWSSTTTTADGGCDVKGYSVDVNSGGTYELWGRIAETARWNTDVPTPVTVTGPSGPTVAFTQGSMGVIMPVGDDVVTLSAWTGVDAPSESPDALAALVTVPTDAEWAALVAASNAPDSPECLDKRAMEAKNADAGTANSDGLPPATIYEVTPPTPAPTTMPPTTVDLSTPGA